MKRRGLTETGLRTSGRCMHMYHGHVYLPGKGQGGRPGWFGPGMGTAARLAHSTVDPAFRTAARVAIKIEDCLVLMSNNPDEEPATRNHLLDNSGALQLQILGSQISTHSTHVVSMAFLSSSF